MSTPERSSASNDQRAKKVGSRAAAYEQEENTTFIDDMPGLGEAAWHTCGLS